MVIEALCDRYGPSGDGSRRICSRPTLEAWSRRGPGPSPQQQHTCDSACLSSRGCRLAQRQTRITGRNDTVTGIPEPSWFLHCRGSGESRPELSGETERLPDARSWAMVIGGLEAGRRLRMVRLRVLRSVGGSRVHRCANTRYMPQWAGKRTIFREWCGERNGDRCLELHPEATSRSRDVVTC